METIKIKLPPSVKANVIHEFLQSGKSYLKVYKEFDIVNKSLRDIDSHERFEGERQEAGIHVGCKVRTGRVLYEGRDFILDSPICYSHRVIATPPMSHYFVILPVMVFPWEIDIVTADNSLIVKAFTFPYQLKTIRLTSKHYVKYVGQRSPVLWEELCTE